MKCEGTGCKVNKFVQEPQLVRGSVLAGPARLLCFLDSVLPGEFHKRAEAQSQHGA